MPRHDFQTIVCNIIIVTIVALFDDMIKYQHGVHCATVTVPEWTRPHDPKSRGSGVNAQVNLAVLLPSSTKYPFSLQRARPSIDVTITRLQHRGMFLRDVINVLYADSKCSSVYAPIEAFNFMTRPEKIHAFIGPVCDYALAPVARYASVWNIPILTPGGLAHDFGQDKTVNPEFERLTRTGANFNTMAQWTSAITTHYRWNTLLVLYEVNGFPEVSDQFCYLAASALVHWSKKAVSQVIEFALFDPEKTNVEELLKKKIGLDYGGKEGMKGGGGGGRKGGREEGEKGRKE